jgi:hypothetical protein
VERRDVRGGFDFQATMFQPVGGTDRIPMAFAGKLCPAIRLSSEVTAIRADGATSTAAFAPTSPPAVLAVSRVDRHCRAGAEAVADRVGKRKHRTYCAVRPGYPQQPAALSL